MLWRSLLSDSVLFSCCLWLFFCDNLSSRIQPGTEKHRDLCASQKNQSIFPIDWEQKQTKSTYINFLTPTNFVPLYSLKPGALIFILLCPLLYESLFRGDLKFNRQLTSCTVQFWTLCHSLEFKPVGTGRNHQSVGFEVVLYVTTSKQFYTLVHLLESVQNCSLYIRQRIINTNVMHCTLAITIVLHFDTRTKH